MTSVGVVVNKETYARRAKSRPDTATIGSSLQALQTIPPDVSSSTQGYLETLELAPGVKKLLEGGKLINHIGTDNNNPKLVHSASDYSYSADRYSGEGWRIIGDAGGGWRMKLVPFIY